MLRRDTLLPKHEYRIVPLVFVFRCRIGAPHIAHEEVWSPPSSEFSFKLDRLSIATLVSSLAQLLPCVGPTMYVLETPAPLSTCRACISGVFLSVPEYLPCARCQSPCKRFDRRRWVASEKKQAQPSGRLGDQARICSQPRDPLRLHRISPSNASSNLMS